MKWSELYSEIWFVHESDDPKELFIEALEEIEEGEIFHFQLCHHNPEKGASLACNDTLRARIMRIEASGKGLAVTLSLAAFPPGIKPGTYTLIFSGSGCLNPPQEMFEDGEVNLAPTDSSWSVD
ncbi:hypothetical protein GF391_04145 [Candidatus Uhrbacteria bacterium]|nr:hypothetical protein [Candidatus Uhrbacteria bacterium]